MFEVYKKKRIFVTGHTGFKGSWFVKWLEMTGASVKGYALEPESADSHFNKIKFDGISVIADILDREILEKELFDFNPEVVFHFAAQPLVKFAYKSPFETFNTNVIGTLNVLQAVRKCSSVKAVVCVTTDKVYENHESHIGYTETDRLGGFDPYSASKACSELVISSYRNSFFKENKVLIASVRSGNVVGGGDWSADRLIPDIVRAILKNKTLNIRNPDSVRPWQHVLDCLSGYLILGERLLSGNAKYAEAWNFGPEERDLPTVAQIVKLASNYFNNLNVKITPEEFNETATLKLDCTKATAQLGWKPLLDNDRAFQLTFEWYKQFQQGKIITETQINNYIELLSNSTQE